MRAAALLAALCIATAISACGDLGGRFRGTQIVPPPRVDDRALARYPSGSPQRAVLGWYGALQRDDVMAVRRYYAHRTAFTTPSALRYQMVRARHFFQRVRLGPLSVEAVRPGSATVVTDLRVRWEARNGRSLEIRNPQSFTLVRERGRWRFPDTYFLGFASHFKPRKTASGW